MDLLEGLNEEQKQAVTHEGGPLLIVAGAGTGKTTVLTRRLAWLIMTGRAKPQEIVALTFTEKAAGEMEERVDQLLPLGYVDLNIGTFHAFCEKLLRAHGLDLGLPADFKVLDQTSAWILVRQNLPRFNLDYYKPRGNPTKFIHALLQHFSRCKDELIGPEDYLKFAEELNLNSDSPDFFKRAGLIEIIEGAGLSEKERKELVGGEVQRITEVACAYHAYQNLLLEEGTLDFGDLISLTHKLLVSRPLVRVHYQNLFKHILVDEFQDTNYAQYELLKILTKPRDNLTVLFDDDQAIYRFRGASVSNILFFKDGYPKAKEIILTHNYRSRQNILDLSYNFIQANNPDRLEYKLETISKKLVALGETGEGIIHHLHFKTIEDEVKGAADKIEEMRLEGASPNDFAILVRANKEAEPFVKELKAREIPHQFLAASGLYLQPIILDLISYGRVLANHCENASLWRILHMPIFNIASEDISLISQMAYKKTWSIFKTLASAAAISGLTEKSRETIAKLLTLIERHAALMKRNPVSLVLLAFLTDSGYLKYISVLPEIKSRPILRDLESFFKIVKLREREIKGLDMRAFLELHEFALDAGDAGSRTFDLEEGPDMVKIMTIHAAKGLEFPYVFIVNMVDQRFPTRERKEPIPFPETLIKEQLPEGDAHLQEERRLLYVAITRAKKGVFLTSADDYGGLRKKKKSRFLEELSIPPVILERAILDPISRFEARRTFLRDDKVVTPQRFSYSQLKAYQICPLQYKFSFVLRVPIKGRYTFSFGKTIHSTLQKFFEEAKKRNQKQQIDLFGNVFPPIAKGGNGGVSNLSFPTEPELIKIYQDSWIDEWYESSEQKKEYFERGRDGLKKFRQDVLGDPPKVLYLEKSFTVKISGETIKGVIDRIDRLEDGVEIIDYKTGLAKNEDSIDKDQLLIYQLAMKRSFGEEAKKLTYYYIEDAHKVSFLGDDKEIEKLEKKILETIDKIKGGDFTAKHERHCQFCDFREICDFRDV